MPDSITLEAARSLRSTVLANRELTEDGRRLAPEVVEALRKTRLCRMALPSELTGLESEPLEALQVYEEMAKAEGSLAVIALNNTLPCFTSRHLEEPERKAIFGDEAVLFANSTRPSGRAIRAEGGFRVSGRWSLVSGCELAGWLALMSVVVDGEAPRMRAPGVPDARFFYIPQGSYTILDTWHVGGLRGTGSHDVVVENAFVPGGYSYSFLDRILVDKPLFRMPLRTTLSAWFAASCIGMAQACVDALIELAGTKVQVDPGPGMRDRASVQTSVATALTNLDAARVLLQTALADVWGTVLGKTRPTDLQQARLFGAALHAAKVAREVAASMQDAAGSSALYTSNPLERAHRDVIALTQHVILNPKFLEDVGRVRLGMAPSSPFV